MLRLVGIRLAGALLLAASSLTSALSVAPSVVLAAPLPAPSCTNDDVLTKYTSTDDWKKTLVDTAYMVHKGYVPPDLVSTANAGLNAGHSIRSLVIPDLIAIANAARDAGAPLKVVSSYRSWKTQKAIFDWNWNKYGYQYAIDHVARPGHSEHQLGVTIDFGSKGGGDSTAYGSTWSQTKQGKWMAANSWKYGFIMSYPDGTQDRTCYVYEAWHFRYLGQTLAAKVHASGLTLREYLWQRYQ